MATQIKYRRPFYFQLVTLLSVNWTTAIKSCTTKNILLPKNQMSSTSANPLPKYKVAFYSNTSGDPLPPNTSCEYLTRVIRKY